MTDPWAKLPAEGLQQNSPEFIKRIEAEFEEHYAVNGGLNPVSLGVKDEASKMISDLGWNLSPSDKITGMELTPTTQLVFECCKCGVIHDPETVSFQTLIDSAKMASWTIKFRDAGYDAYCKDHSP